MNIKALLALSGVGIMCAIASTVQAAKPSDLYAGSCSTCHAAGVLGAPKSGDTAAWAPRLKQGRTELLNHVKNGYKNMPARGLCDTCTDADYTALIDMMTR